MGKQAQSGDKVSIHYTGTTGDGTEFDSSRDRDPLEFTLGENQVIPGFEKAVEGMEVEEKKEVTVEAGDAYGERREDLMVTVDKSRLPENLEVKVGDTLKLENPNGNPTLVRVKDVTDDTVTLDANHPLAGEDLTFDIEVTDIEKEGQDNE